MKIEPDNVYNMDCLAGMGCMGDGSVDCCVTSPPYNFCLRVMGDRYVKRHSGEKDSKRRVFNKYEGRPGSFSDSLEMKEWFDWQCRCIDEMLRISRETVFWNVQIVTGNKPAVLRILGAYAERVRDVLVWDKLCAEPAVGSGVLNSEFELIVAFDHGDCKGRRFRTMNAGRGTLSNIIRIGKNRENKHRAAFPLSLASWIVRNFAPQEGVVCDPFMGSGTTAVACIGEGRHFVGFELSGEWCEVARKRIQEEKRQGRLFCGVG